MVNEKKNLKWNETEKIKNFRVKIISPSNPYYLDEPVKTKLIPEKDSDKLTGNNKIKETMNY
ncbi:MAG: hypothetical protein DRP06_02670 [Candidatus Aenigmatarchaeota archaeon]|nr:MAG: hypothetical protein DRP06_02670 [Candidatus Aenigmarchaeota archaeon]